MEASNYKFRVYVSAFTFYLSFQMSRHSWRLVIVVFIHIFKGFSFLTYVSEWAKRSPVDSFSENPVTEQLSCPVCNYVFKGNKIGNLNRHMKLHEATQKRFVCNQCDRSYQNKSNFNDHKTVHHNNVNESTITWTIVSVKEKGISKKFW